MAVDSVDRSSQCLKALSRTRSPNRDSRTSERASLKPIVRLSKGFGYRYHPNSQTRIMHHAAHTSTTREELKTLLLDEVVSMWLLWMLVNRFNIIAR